MKNIQYFLVDVVDHSGISFLYEIIAANIFIFTIYLQVEVYTFFGVSCFPLNQNEVESSLKIRHLIEREYNIFASAKLFVVNLSNHFFLV